MKQIVDKPSPVTGGVLELCSKPATVEFRGESIPYEKLFYHCVDSDLSFGDDELETANLKRIYDTYRRRHGIPTAEELRRMRERYGIPSGAMSVILGLGENQYGLYEDGTVPTLSVGKLLALAASPAIMARMLQYARGAFSDKQYSKYYKAIASSMHPARYGVERIGVQDYGVYPSFPPSRIVIRDAVTSSKKIPYNK